MSATETTRFRLGVLAIVIVALFAALFGRLWYLQVMTSEPYSLEAEANRVRVVQVEAPRGRILDVNGTVLVDNRVSTVVTVDRVVFTELNKEGDLDDVIFLDNGAGDGVEGNGVQDGDEKAARGEAAELVRRLADEMSRYGSPATVDDLLRRIFDVRFTQYAPVPIAEDVTEELKIYLDEHSDEFPGVTASRSAIRRYPYGTRAAHLLGYVGEINDEELEDRANKPKTYVQGDHTGKSGIERIYEDDLRGTPGQTVYEVDARGNPVRVLEDQSRPPIPGDDVWLSIDIRVQAYAEDLLAQALEDARSRPPSGDNPWNKGTGGAVVVQNPQNGDILAMASYPTYDPRDFINGITASRYDYLTDEANEQPLTNRAVQGQYAPGSTFKLISGYAALIDGIRAPDTPYYDTGSHTLSDCAGDRCTFYNAGRAALGTVNMTSAITVSSDAYFYSVGEDFWNARGSLGEEAMQDSARDFGLGEETGIPLPGESSGRIPTPRQRKEQYEANPDLFLTGAWYTGDNVNMAIGQGDVAVTPLQLANAYATFGNGGIRYAPNVASKVTWGGNETVTKRTIEARENGRLELPEHIRQSLLNGLVGVTSGYGGTATTSFSGFPHDSFPVAAKTGTAQVNGKADTAVFVAFGPAPNPQYAVSVFMEESGFGGTAAAPVTRSLFDVFAGVTPTPDIQPGGELLFPTDDATAVAASAGEEAQ